MEIEGSPWLKTLSASPCVERQKQTLAEGRPCARQERLDVSRRCRTGKCRLLFPHNVPSCVTLQTACTLMLLSLSLLPRELSLLRLRASGRSTGS